MAKKNNNEDRIIAIVLAAGKSKRFGQPKQLVSFRGKRLIANIVREVTKSTADSVVVVLGYKHDKIRPALAAFTNLRIVVNPDYARGMSSSLKAGLEKAKGSFDAVMIVLGDLAGLKAQDIDKVIETYKNSTCPLAIGIIGGKPAHPIIFGKDLWGELSTLSGDVGGRLIVEKYIDKAAKVELPESAGFDIDTAGDYESLIGGSEHG